MIRPLKISVLACCGILLAASQPPQTTDMAGARANIFNETIEGLVRDVACPIQPKVLQGLLAKIQALSLAEIDNIKTLRDVVLGLEQLAGSAHAQV